MASTGKSSIRTGWTWLAIVVAITSAPAAAQSSRVLFDSTGEVTRSDRTDREGNHYDDFSVSLPNGADFQIDVQRRSTFDPLVEVFSSSGELIGSDDDGGGDFNSLLRFRADRGNRYTIRVRGYQASLGPYRVVVTQTSNVGPASHNRLYGPRSGFISFNAPQMANGTRYEDYVVQLRSGDTILLNANSTQFDPMLFVYSASNLARSLASDDDSGGGNNAFLMFTAPQTGEYVVRVGQYAQATGSYELIPRRVVPF